MGGKETVESIIRNYSTTVKPFLDKGQYYFAGMELANLRDIAARQTRDILGTVHMGGNFITALRGLEEACRQTPARPDYIASVKTDFEAYAAQTRLPKGSAE